MIPEIILITHPKKLMGEHDLVLELLDEGMPKIHIRKDGFEEIHYRNYLNMMPKKYRQKLIIHEHLALAEKYQLFGCHFKAHQEAKTSHKIEVGQSSHSFKAIEATKANHTYLSPIHNSISKQGYPSKFNAIELEAFLKEKPLHKKVYALGGVTCDNAAKTLAMGFDGLVLHGHIWEEVHTFKMIDKIKRLLDIIG